MAEGCQSLVVAMFKERPRYGDNPARAGGERWLLNAQQQKVVQFKPDASTVQPNGWRCSSRWAAAVLRTGSFQVIKGMGH